MAIFQNEDLENRKIYAKKHLALIDNKFNILGRWYVYCLH